MSNVNRQWILRSRPKGLLAPGDLQLTEAPVPSPTDGQALAGVKYLSIDPTMRNWLADRPSYAPAVAIGEVMRAFGFAEVIESRNKDYKKGDKIVGLTGLQDYVIVDGAEKRPFQKVPPVPFVSDTAFLGVLGINGLTAYFGMMEIGKPQKGETLVVSAAAGATGSIAGQIGKIHGCRVVGIAGTDEKCKWITEELGFDAAINYKHPDWKEKLAAATPKGIDINAFGRGGCELFFPVGMLVVDRGVEAELLGNPLALFIGSRDADHAAAMNFADLPGDAAGSARRGGNHQRFALLRLSYFHHAEVSGQAINSQDAEKGRVGNKRHGRNFLKRPLFRAVHDHVILQAR